MEHIFIQPKIRIDNLIIAISTRYGGVSHSPYDTMNTALHVGDSESDVFENRKILFNALNIDINSSVFADQIHSTDVHKVESCDIGCGALNAQTAIQTDSFITNLKNVPIVIQTADCLSIVLYAKDKQAIANIHCGWKGLAHGIIQNTIEAMINAYGINSKEIYAYLGACIKPNNFNVSEDVASIFQNPIIKNCEFYVDLALEAKLILEKYSVVNIENSYLDSHEERFYSYRRDNKITGRMSTIAMLL